MYFGFTRLVRDFGRHQKEYVKMKCTNMKYAKNEICKRV